ncbi:MAG: hypothetical protein M3Z01_04350 [Thermoproteota archaeon]|nr:hypothetical protein [Thermoproteota archaeon]
MDIKRNFITNHTTPNKSMYCLFNGKVATLIFPLTVFILFVSNIETSYLNQVLAIPIPNSNTKSIGGLPPPPPPLVSTQNQNQNQNHIAIPSSKLCVGGGAVPCGKPTTTILIISPAKINIISNNGNTNLTTTFNGHSTITISQGATLTTITN